MTKKPFTECSKCGTPQVPDTHSLMLLFKTPEDREEFKVMVEAVFGDRMTAYSVGSVGSDNDG